MAMSRSARLLWFLALCLVIIDILGLYITGLSLNLVMFFRYLLLVGMLAGLVQANLRFGGDPRIAFILHIEALTLTFSVLTIILSYIAIGLQRPLVDSDLVAADQAFGFDWLAFYKWVTARPMLHAGLVGIYASFLPQMVLLQIILVMRRHFSRARELLWLFVVSCMVCIVIAGFLPAAAAFGYYHVELNTPYIHDIIGLHDGTLRIIGQTPIQGIIAFPSFHVAMGVLYVYAARGIKIFFPLLIVINILMIISTLPIGGHYLVDVMAGIIVALMTIIVARHWILPQAEGVTEV